MMREFELNNGIKSVYKKNNETPRMALTMNFSINNEEKFAGTYSLMTRLLLQGTTTYNNEELAKILDENGIELIADMKQDYLRFRLLCLNEDFAKALELLADIVKNSTFEEFDKEKVKIPIANLQNRWIYLNGQLALYNETNASIPIERLIYYEVTFKKLWLECIINDKFISHETSIIQLLLIEHQDFKSIFSTSVNIDFSLCNNRKEFADQTLLVLNVRWKKYLERVYLSLMDLYIIIKNFI